MVNYKIAMKNQKYPHLKPVLWNFLQEQMVTLYVILRFLTLKKLIINIKFCTVNLLNTYLRGKLVLQQFSTLNS